MRIHLVAVAGTGMGALAGLLQQLGHEVSGSDVAFHPPMGPALAAWGIRCLEGFAAEHLEPPPDRVVIGNVCRRDNVEAVAAFERGLPVMHIAGALQEFVLNGTSPLVVTGTHGKTTTTALTAYLLDRTGFDPGFLIGGLPMDFERSARPARTRTISLPIESGARPQTSSAGTVRSDGGTPRRTPFVIEGDEYDTAFFEKSAKFLHYRAEVCVITSIEQDHIDIYPTFADYRRSFERLVEKVPESGLIVAYAGDETVVEVVRAHARAPVTFYALDEDNPRGVAVHWLGASTPSRREVNEFDLYAGGVFAGRFSTRMPGKHNARNALAALAACAEGFGAPLDRLRGALAQFSGVARR
ncbi:MAG TPA: Mur ligase family protein, partial [Polyangiaceae bacterium]